MTASTSRAFGKGQVVAALSAWGHSDATVSPLPHGASGEVFLVETTARRFVAKHAYMDRRDFEPGLLAAEVVARRTPFAAAAPVRTRTGDLVVMVEHDGSVHPLALMEWVEGHAVAVDSVAAAVELGQVLGTVQRTLTSLAPTDLGIAAEPRAFLAYLRSMTQDLGEYHWLHARIAEIVRDVDALLDRGTLTFACGVWDGPERLRDSTGRIGLVDFGNTGWYPVAHVIGYGTSQVRVADEADEAQAVDSFIASFVDAHPVSSADLDAVGLFRLATIATYAKFMARRAASSQLPRAMTVGFRRVLAELGHDR